MFLSGQVYEAEDGSLQGVCAAVSRSKNLTCSRCETRGATIGCCHEDCGANYHFSCALAARADFKEDKTVYCYKHAQRHASKDNVESFSVERCVWVDLAGEEERGRARKARFVDYRSLNFTLGSLHVDSLGMIVSASAAKNALVPAGLSAVRTFWSTVNPRRRTKYRISTRYFIINLF